jgi:hypothetical protein
MENNKILIISALLYGIISILIFLTPFFLYSKNKDDMQREGVLKVVGEVLFWHVILVVASIIFSSAINAGISLRPEYTPSQGLKYFYGALSGGSPNTMWSYWLGKDLKGVLSGNSPEGSLIAVAIVAFKYIAIFLFITSIIIPLAVLWQTIGSIFSMGKSNQNPHYNDHFAVVQSAFIHFFGMTALVIVHCEISSLYVKLYISNFSFFKMIGYTWQTLLFGA